MSQGSIREINGNPYFFEELATSISSVLQYYPNVTEMLTDFEHVYRRALSQPPSYQEVTEMAGPGLTTGDRRSGRAAWLLRNIRDLQIIGVHSQLWHNVAGDFSAPVLDQVGTALSMRSQLSESDLQLLGDENTSLLDVLGVADNSIWLVQAIWDENLQDSVFSNQFQRDGRLFRSAVFNKPTLGKKPTETLYNAWHVIKKAFPNAPIRAMGLAMSPRSPDFELYQLEIAERRKETMVFRSDRIVTNSLDYIETIRQDREALWGLPERLTNPVFKGLPPCRGGRTLGILGALASRQVQNVGLLTWRQSSVISVLKESFDLCIPRDKVRHDLDDRLVGQGFLRKVGSDYFVSPKGIARYFYCLAKYTTIGNDDPMAVLEACRRQQELIRGTFGGI